MAKFLNIPVETETFEGTEPLMEGSDIIDTARNPDDEDGEAEELGVIYPAMNELAKVVSKGSEDDASDALMEFCNTVESRGKAWASAVRNMRGMVQSEFSVIPYTVITPGNSKLDFWAWSVIPMHTCPGAGACKDWCYSFTGWRNVAPFFRQIQNTFLQRFYQPVIVEVFDTLKTEKRKWIRLYVDGDFDSVETINFWVEAIRTRKELSAYCYTKSWDQFIEYQDILAQNGEAWPDNFVVNLSTGSIHGEAKYNQMLAMKCARGPFIPITIPKTMPKVKALPSPKKGMTDAQRAEVKQNAARIAVENRTLRDTIYAPFIRHELRDHYGAEHTFACPADCTKCMDKEGKTGKHACGLIKLKVAIGCALH
jgi:hypothetical protein